MKMRYPLSMAQDVAGKLLEALRPYCTRIVVAGSVRRGKPLVGDVELLYISKISTMADLFGPAEPYAQADEVLRALIDSGVIERRYNVNGSPMWGEKNKFARHVNTGMPVDLFATDEACWENYLVCRTGPGELNTEIAMRAKQRGLMWHPYGTGFERVATGEVLPVKTEGEVFDIVGLPRMEPRERCDWEARAEPRKGKWKSAKRAAA